MSTGDSPTLLPPSAGNSDLTRTGSMSKRQKDEGDSGEKAACSPEAPFKTPDTPFIVFSL